MIKPLRKRYKIEGSIKDSGFGLLAMKAAESLGVAGFIKDSDGSVIIEAEGTNLNRFIKKILEAPLPTVVIDRISEEYIPAIGETIFRITGNDALLGLDGFFQAKDTALCKQCKAEIFDQSNRRYNYPFTSCPECGKKFSSFKAFPPERENTVYAHFELCRHCKFEYNDPLDRRFHHHRISCPECGPKLWLAASPEASARLVSHDHRLNHRETIASIKGLLISGQVIGVSLRGGYSLVCSALSTKTVERINGWRRHSAEAYYIMVRDIQQCQEYFEVNEEDANTLNEGGRPVVFLKVKDGNFNYEGCLKDRRNEMGVSIAQTGLEYLLTENAPPLAIFFGAAEGETQEVKPEEAIDRLKGGADYFVFSDTRAKLAVKPTIIRTAWGRKYILRLGSGSTPLLMDLPFVTDKMILTTGGDVNNAFCFAKGEEALISHQIGDLKYFSSYKAFEKSIYRYYKLNNFNPDIIITDLQPDYIVSNWAEKQRKPLKRIQHHSAHAAACLAENKYQGKAVVIVFDGGGYGSDGALWGGEFFTGSLSSGFKRQGHIKYFDIPLNSEDRPDAWSFAISMLRSIYGLEWRSKAPEKFLISLDEEESGIVETALENRFNLRSTSSAGRFIKGIASLVLPRKREGESNAVEFASLIEKGVIDEGNIPAAAEYSYIIENMGAVILNLDSFIVETAADLNAGVEIGAISRRFHHSLACAAAEMGVILAGKTDCDTVGLSGGTFQSPILLEMIIGILKSKGLKVLTHRQLPCGDGNLCFGQAALAGMSLQNNMISLEQRKRGVTQ